MSGNPARDAERILRQGAQGAQTRAVRRASKNAVQIVKKATTSRKHWPEGGA